MRADTIVGYTYKADTYCPRCIVKAVVAPLRELGLSTDTEEALAHVAHFRGIDRMDEITYDSDDFPKVVFADQAVAEDGDPDSGIWADQCAACGNRLI